MSEMIYSYGIISIVSAVLFLLLVRERPSTAPCLPEQEERSFGFTGLKDTLHNKAFYWLMFIFFVGLGVFICVATWIEDIIKPRGFTAEQAGITGGVMILGGIIGAIIMPLLSDHIQKKGSFYYNCTCLELSLDLQA